MQSRNNLLVMSLMMVGLLAGPMAFSRGQSEGETQESGPAKRLTIGDKAPALDIEHWLTDNHGLFLHTTKFEEDMVYVIDFWNPEWRGTILAMPRLAKLQEKYDSKLQIISVGVSAQARFDLGDAEAFMEKEAPDSVGLEAETYRDVVEGYCLTVDPDNSVFEDYVVASGYPTVPCSFIIKQKTIQWIGSTLEIDEPLEQIISGKFDRDVFAKQHQQEMDNVAKQAEAAQQVAKILAKLPEKMREGADTALDYLQQQVEDNEDKLVKRQLAEIRLQMMVGLRKEDAPEAMRAFADDFTDEKTAGELNDLIWKLYERHEEYGDVSDEMLRAARYAAEVAVKFDPDSGAINDTVAHFVYLDGDLDKAIEWQKKAVANANGRESDLQPFLDKLLNEKETGEKALDIKRPKPKKDKSDF